MGTYIESAATSHLRGTWPWRGALYLSDVAARAALARGHRAANELDILVNAGLYKNGNLAEPALASIIQEDVGANPGHPPRLDRHGTFSFDVLNGGCGVVTAVQLVDGFVGPGGAQVGLVVAADANPSPRGARGFPFAPVGGALLLVHGDDGAGFRRFALRTFAEHAGLFEARVRCDPAAGVLHRGRNVLEIFEAPAFAAVSAEHAIGAARSFLDEAGLTAADVDLMIANQYPRGFAARVARGLGLAEACVPSVSSAITPAHTAGPIAALESALTSGRLARARHVLFVTAGAGLTIGLALYVPPPRVSPVRYPGTGDN